MPHVLVRGLPEPVVERLKRRAQRNARSLNAEIRAILEQAAQEADAGPGELAGRARALFQERRFDDSTPLIREDRER